MADGGVARTVDGGVTDNNVLRITDMGRRGDVDGSGARTLEACVGDVPVAVFARLLMEGKEDESLMEGKHVKR